MTVEEIINDLCSFKITKGEAVIMINKIINNTVLRQIDRVITTIPNSEDRKECIKEMKWELPKRYR